MKWLLILLPLSLCAQPRFQVRATWSYPSNSLFQFSGDFGSLLTASKTAVVSVPAGHQTFTVAAQSQMGVLSENNPTQTVTIVGTVLDRSTNLTTWTPIQTNTFVLTNQFTNGFFRARMFLQ